MSEINGGEGELDCLDQVHQPVLGVLVDELQHGLRELGLLWKHQEQNYQDIFEKLARAKTAPIPLGCKRIRCARSLLIVHDPSTSASDHVGGFVRSINLKSLVRKFSNLSTR